MPVTSSVPSSQHGLRWGHPGTWGGLVWGAGEILQLWVLEEVTLERPASVLSWERTVCSRSAG